MIACSDAIRVSFNVCAGRKKKPNVTSKDAVGVIARHGELSCTRGGLPRPPREPQLAAGVFRIWLAGGGVRLKTGQRANKGSFYASQRLTSVC